MTARWAAWFLVAGVVAVSAAAAMAEGEHRLIPGQSASGVISEAGEEDFIEIFALEGQKITVQVKARKGETLLPTITAFSDPDDTSLLGSATIVRAKKGNAVTLKSFIPSKSGVHVLRLGGDSLSTGIYDLKSKGAPSNLRLGGGTVSTPGEEVPFVFPAEVNTEVALQVKADKGSTLQPFMASLTGPEGEVDLAGGLRKTSTKKDQVKKLFLADNGEHTLAVTGAEDTTGAFSVFLKIGKKTVLDFSVDPPVDPGTLPPVIGGVSPSTFDAPSTGNSMTVSGSRFEDGAVATFSPSTGITGVTTTFQSANSLLVQFNVADGATPGARSLTVTNPGGLADTESDAITLETAAVGLQLYSVSPAGGSPFGGTRVLLQGENIVAVTKVRFGGIDAGAVLRVDDKNVLCTVPPAASPSPAGGTAVDVLLEINGSESKTLAGGFTYDADSSAPTVVLTVPAGGATGVPTNLQKAVFLLSDRTAPGTLVSGTFDFFRSSQSGPNDINNPRVSSVATGPGGRAVVIQRGVAQFGNLSTNSIYVMEIPDTVTDRAGNALDPTPFGGSAYQGSFTTGTTTDTTAPSVTSTTPAANATGVDIDAVILLQFSEAIDPSLLAGAISLMQGVTAVPFDLEVDPSMMSAILTPRFALFTSTTYTLAVTATLRDLSGNALSPAVSRTFTTAASDGTAPSARVTVDALPDDMNGSGTYVNSGGSGGNAFDVYLPRDGFTIDLDFSDAGGSGIDGSTLSVTCNKAMGGIGAGQNLASLFTVTPLGATWTVDSSHALAVSSNVTFTATVQDYAGNTSPAAALTVDVADITKTISGSNGNASTDRDPFNARQSWLLRFDQDLWTITASDGGGGNINVSTSLTSNGTSDFREDLVLVGLNGTESGTNASTVTNGTSTGTNAIVQRLVREAIRGRLNERYGIAYDGTRSADSVDIEFLLAGEQGSVSTLPNPATWTGGKGYSMMTFTGDERPNSNVTTIGRANFDLRNKSEDDDSNTGDNTGNNLGTFATHMARVRINDQSTSLFRVTFDPLIATAGRGGTPVGSSNLDAVVLDDSFDYASANGSQKARFDLIMAAIDRWSLYLSFVGAHEMGHSVGLVADDAPPTGLFGGAHEGNTFVVNGGFTTSGHLDTAGNNIMEAASGFTASTATGDTFAVFGPLNLAYLLRRMIYDQ